MCSVVITSLKLNRCLLDNQKSWKDRVTGLESRLEDVVKQKDTVSTHTHTLVEVNSFFWLGSRRSKT